MLLKRLCKQPWFLMILTTLIALVAALIYLQQATPIYVSTALILIEPGPVPLGMGQNFLPAQTTVITSRPVLERALDDPNMLTLAESADPTDMDDLVATLTATVREHTDIIEISASSPHPEDAATFVNAVVKTYIKWHETQKTLAAVKALNDLQVELAQYRNNLEHKRRGLRRLADIRDSQARDRDAKRTSEMLDRLQHELVEAEIAKHKAESFYKQLQGYEKEPDKFRQYLRVHGGPLGIAVSEAETEEGAAGSDERFVQRHLSLAQAFAEDARVRHEELLEQYDQTREHARTLGSFAGEGEYKDILSECEVLEDLCSQHVREITELKVSIPPGLKIHVLEEAVPARMPSKPNKARIMSLATIVGLVVGAMLAVMARSLVRP